MSNALTINDRTYLSYSNEKLLFLLSQYCIRGSKIPSTGGMENRRFEGVVNTRPLPIGFDDCI